MLQAAVFTCFLLLFSLLLRGTLFFLPHQKLPYPPLPFPSLCPRRLQSLRTAPVSLLFVTDRSWIREYIHQRLRHLRGGHSAGAVPMPASPLPAAGLCSPRLFCPVMVIVVLSSLPSVPAHGFRQPWGTKETAYGSAGCADHGKQR